MDEEVSVEPPSKQDVHVQYTDARKLRVGSPFTSVFRRTIDEVSLDDDNDAVPENTLYSPPCFRAVQAIIHLYPLWSAVFQNDVKRFGNDQSSEAISAAASTSPTCQTNAAVESHFRSVKRGRLGGRLRQRPYQFVAAELQYVTGKVNKTKMPKLLTRKKKDLSQKEEAWKRQKRPAKAKYADPARAAKIIKSVTRSKRRLPHDVLRKELSDNAIEVVQGHLRQMFPSIDGLQAPGLGQCVRDQSLPRFPAAQ